MITVGLDLASDPRKTGLARIEWSAGGARLADLRLGVGDDDAVAAVQDCDKAGVDVPLGWPRAFVHLVSEHAGHGSVPATAPWPAQRLGLQFRHTDLVVRERTGRLPLSVSTDKIALPALRWTGIEARLTGLGLDCPRSGEGRVAEVYPAAALSTWGLASRGYKGSGATKAAQVAARAQLVVAVGSAFGFLDLGPHTAAMAASDDALDAVVCALVARAVALGLTLPAPAESAARVEGWIHLPACRPEDLVRTV